MGKPGNFRAVLRMTGNMVLGWKKRKRGIKKGKKLAQTVTIM